MKNIFITFILIVLALGQRVYAEKQESLLIVRSARSNPPQEIITSDNKMTGLHIDIIYTIAGILKIKIEFISVPWKRAIRMMKNGEADAITYTRYQSKCIYQSRARTLRQGAT
ncbi:substrate-binding periplasmic protein [Psychromonas ossibalaenae]|uniref:substrate-binding periplasmic protein n=1 Tax=Psychromonas ossibalaenae TaxID=444922 RepID=UPI0003621E32|nr:transporter substrate-binding domain-containing protein [Psychromonas ossibalaenae]